MGLDITAYRQLEPAPHAELDGDGFPVDGKKYVWLDRASIEWTEQHWPGHSGGIKPGVYAFAQAHSFRAGSYGGYNAWRDELARVMHGRSAEELWDGKVAGPFIELITFADNEGIIGPQVAAKLAKDFADHQAKAEQVGDDYFLAKYNAWRLAFELAADGGAVNFH